MKLSSAQVQRFWREWAITCKVRSWTRPGMTTGEIDAKRKELLAHCGFRSLTEVDRTDGFTAVLHTVIAERGDSIRSAHETIDPSLNQARILRNQILTELIPCLELYITDVRAYINELARFLKIREAFGEVDLTRLNFSQLKQVQYTLSARLNAKRNESGESIHDMKIRAQVPCDCAQCRRPEFVRQEVTAGEVPESETEPSPL